ncbi:hypothetical protein K7W03_02410 [Sphingobium sp. PNB]|uniref:hypothetical protein n=1 Tax=Sphingobium sp. PNB TaxID=863934 RepID=UPI001CA38849|nr:hypothetical protein [Sphingobium sp. PNB]MCB4858443.1 hypothetical protein [Sphingobium sp. PNB]
MTIGLDSAQNQSVSSRFAAAGYTFTPQNKDRDGDGKVSRQEFKMPTLPGTTQASITPADFSAAPSLDQTFDAYDRNKDGFIDTNEEKSGPMFSQHYGNTDRFSNNWADSMTTQQALAYFNRVDADNAAVLKQWGISL